MPRLATAILCTRPDCALPRRHRDGCDNPDNDDHSEGACGGCLPAQAADGLNLCQLHADRIPEDALMCARLHTDLELQLRRQGRGEFTSGSRDRSNMPDEAVMDARFALADVLTKLVELMVSVRGFTPPNPNRSHGGRMATKVEVLAATVAQHSLWFAAHADAGKHSKVLHDITHGTITVKDGDKERKIRPWSLAYPSRTKEFQEIGSCPLLLSSLDGEEEVCGGTVFWYPEQSALAYCDSCDQAETIEWWRLKILGNPDAVIDTVAGAAWLSDKWRRPVMPSQIANWASRDKLPRLTEKVLEHGKEVDKPVKDTRGRQLYRLTELEACATKMFGEPAPANSRGKVVAA